MKLTGWLKSLFCTGSWRYPLMIVGMLCTTREPFQIPVVAGDTQDEHLRAGCPRSIAPWAQPFPRPSYRGYYVGGGAPLTGHSPATFRGAARRLDEGTFGVDYVPWRSKVQLRWYHGRRYQGGEGQYATEKE